MLLIILLIVQDLQDLWKYKDPSFNSGEQFLG